MGLGDILHVACSLSIENESAQHQEEKRRELLKKRANLSHSTKDYDEGGKEGFLN